MKTMNVASVGCSFDVLTNTLTLTHSFYKASKVCGSCEYNLLMETVKQHPGATLTVKKKDASKKLTYKMMRDFIIATNDKKDAMNYLAELETKRAFSKIQKDPYKYVLNWFANTFEGASDLIKNTKEEKTEKPNSINVDKVLALPSGNNSALDFQKVRDNAIAS